MLCFGFLICVVIVARMLGWFLVIGVCRFVGLVKITILYFIVINYDIYLLNLSMKLLILHFLLLIICNFKFIFQVNYIFNWMPQNTISKSYHIYAKLNLTQLAKSISNQTTIHTHHTKTNFLNTPTSNEIS